MKKLFASLLSLTMTFTIVLAQTGPTAQQQAQPPNEQDEDIVRITTQLVQVDAVVTDKNDQIIPDLKLEDFKIYENGKRQDLQFMEYVSADSGPRTEGTVTVAGHAVEPEAVRNLAGHEHHTARSLFCLGTRRAL